MDYILMADVEVTSVRHERSGFALEGRGADRADYRVELELEVPVDQRTRSVLGELLSQSRWRISRKATQALRSNTRPAPSRGKPAAS